MATFVKMNLPKKLEDKLEKRRENDSLRQLSQKKGLIDFSSNDYLGLSNSKTVFQATHNYLIENEIIQNGATGSRLISGNHFLYEKVEEFLSKFYKSDTALIFNSGYDANIGFFSSVPQRSDVILYDEYIHASIRDGITMSNAKSYKFKHNDLQHLKNLMQRHSELVSESNINIYVVTESVFSMDGDSPDLEKMSKMVSQYNAYFVVDEAHAIGVFGEKGLGKLNNVIFKGKVFARIITFGKALGCHGAAILGNEKLKTYLVNFARSLMYTTGLPPHSLATILMSHQEMVKSNHQNKLTENISFFLQELKRLKLEELFIKNDSPIHSCVISGNKKVKQIANQLQEKGFDVKAILSPTVPKNEERIRFCIHSYNSFEEITNVLETLRIFV